jgi:phosphatidylethanolamine/phosphatidyl-N-methylethanolamine N-methyltransferase
MDIKEIYNRLAPIYDIWDTTPELLLYRSWRRWLWNGLNAQRILEISIGTGKNIPFYPKGAQLTAIDISYKMLEKAAEKAALRKDISLEFITMDVMSMTFTENTFDAVVGSFALTVLPDPIGALHRIKQLLNPGGVLRVLELNSSNNKVIALIQRSLSPFARYTYQAHLNRDISAMIAASGFVIESSKELMGGIAKIIFAIRPE